MSIIYKLFIIIMSERGMPYLELDWIAVKGSVSLSQSLASYEGAKVFEVQWIALMRANFYWVALTLSPPSTEALRLAMMQNTFEEIEGYTKLAMLTASFSDAWC